ncbi:penicillin-binding protein 2 [Coxiella endosymbiont of Amblyomma nuttalli]|uniref:penicillin-binding protein 2 n=1 Tax=Coxiella endosymbiont of Amblyomma nuttalli TaxID=2749996 RepID=UPI001BA4DB26|nr:penicillin-binding protein 2 [Coxiella endosymbiont of Amblyomma nuttalli]QTS83883.1 Peptidoglycan D,D-transpeptidase [Coxiella endosymbiont of Amblyomma nuttalli]
MKKQPLVIKNIQLEIRLFKSRCLMALLLLFVFAFILTSRLAYLQIKNHCFYSTLSRHNLLNIIPIQPKRGLIFDRNGLLLAKDIPIYTLAIVPDTIKHLEKTIKQLSKIIPISKDEIKRFHHIAYQYRPYQPIPLKYKLTNEVVARFYVNRYRFPQVEIETRMTRYYPLADITSDVLGYVGRISPQELQKVNTSSYTADDDVGKMGIEKYYEKQLRGTLGIKEVEIDASGRIVRILKEIPPSAGDNIYLTIDSNLQAEAKRVLGDENGAIVVMTPNTGQILALVTKPSFNPNPFVSGLSVQAYQRLLHSPLHPLYNRAIRGQFASGSTIKPFLAVFGLDEGIVTHQYQIYDPGWFQLPNTKHIYHDWQPTGHGWVNIVKAIAVSCDVYFYNLAVMMGIDQIDRILYKFGFGQLTGIDLPEEVPGLVPSPRWKRDTQGCPWYTGDTIETGIGQGFFLVTPLQLVQAVSIIAEHGKRYRPTLLFKSVAPDGTEMIPQPISETPVILKNLNNWDIIIRAMQEVVDKPWGTADFFGKHSGFTVAAKTATAQIYGHQRDEDASRANIPKQLRNNHLFIAFASVDHPTIAVAVVVEHNAMADKITGEIMNYYFNHLTKTQDAPSTATQ